MTVRINIEALQRQIFEETGQMISLQAISAKVTGVVSRVQPCYVHSLLATGETWHDAGVNVSPNGFRPDCGQCVATEPVREEIDFEV